jgi:hypothetical protein
MGRACRTNYGEDEIYRILVGKPEGRPRSRWVDNIKRDLREIGWDEMGRACSTHGRKEKCI